MFNIIISIFSCYIYIYIYLFKKKEIYRNSKYLKYKKQKNNLNNRLEINSRESNNI